MNYHHFRTKKILSILSRLLNFPRRDKKKKTEHVYSENDYARRGPIQ